MLTHSLRLDPQEMKQRKGVGKGREESLLEDEVERCFFGLGSQPYSLIVFFFVLVELGL